MTEIKRELPIGGLDAAAGEGLGTTEDDRSKRVVLRIRAGAGEDPDDAKRERSVVFNAYNLALHSELFCIAMSLEYPLVQGSTAPCIENIDFSAMPIDPYSDPRSIFIVPERKGEESPVSVDSLRFLANFVNKVGPVEPERKKFKWFPPHQYMEIIYQSYDSIPELFQYYEDANRMGFGSLTHFIASEIAAQLRMFIGEQRSATKEEVRDFRTGEYTPNHDTPRRGYMLEDQRSDRIVNATIAEMRQSEAKRAT